MWGRGLKHSTCQDGLEFLVSPPMWGRGLKHVALLVLLILDVSPPMWGRGLKRVGDNRLFRGVVAPHVGAWIETFRQIDRTSPCRPPCGGVD